MPDQITFIPTIPNQPTPDQTTPDQSLPDLLTHLNEPNNSILTKKIIDHSMNIMADPKTRGVFDCNPCNPCNPWKSGKNGKTVELLRVFEIFEHSATPENPKTPFSTPGTFLTIRPCLKPRQTSSTNILES